MKQVNKKFGIGHYLNYFKENYFISLKEFLEFKSNMYNLILVEIFFAAVFIFFGSILLTNFNTILNWDIYDFILLYFIINAIDDISGLFWYNKLISWRIKKGDFNSFLYLPGNPLLNFVFSKSFNLTFLILIYLSIIVFVLIKVSTQIHLIFLALSIILTLIFLRTMTFHFFSSISWYSLEFGESVSSTYHQIASTFKEYPFQFFKNVKFKIVSLFFILTFVSSLVIPIIRGYPIWNIKIQMIILIGLCIITTLLTLLNWKYGLKKYEAFG